MEPSLNNILPLTYSLSPEIQRYRLKLLDNDSTVTATNRQQPIPMDENVNSSLEYIYKQGVFSIVLFIIGIILLLSIILYFISKYFNNKRFKQNV
jgi:hypothetical protein